LTADGKLYSWGSCEYYSLGLGKSIKSVLFPTLIPVLADIPIARIDVGEYHCAAVSTDGDVFTWGWGGGFLYGTWMERVHGCMLRAVMFAC
jgi:alpha-tubulin suppressor-like RCC1 family protein